MVQPFNYQTIADTIKPFTERVHWYEGLAMTGLITSVFGLVGCLMGMSKDTPLTNKDYVKLAGAVAVLSLVIFGTAVFFAKSQNCRRQINEGISKAVVAEDGVMTKAKEVFLQTFGKFCTRLLGKEKCYLTQQADLMKYLPRSTIFYNVDLEVSQYLDPSYTPPRNNR